MPTETTPLITAIPPRSDADWDLYVARREAYRGAGPLPADVADELALLDTDSTAILESHRDAAEGARTHEHVSSYETGRDIAHVSRVWLDAIHVARHGVSGLCPPTISAETADRYVALVDAWRTEALIRRGATQAI